MTEISRGNFDGDLVEIFTLKNDNIELGVINYGASVVFLKTSDRNGVKGDIVTGFDTMEEYYQKSTFFGSTIGRVANRIAGGKFEINGNMYKLNINNGPNTNHGGDGGFDKKMWTGEIEGDSVVFSLLSENQDEGFPGNLKVSVKYSLNGNTVEIGYQATTDQSTPINLTNHCFYNLGGHEDWRNDLSDHEIMISANHYLPTDGDCLVTGEICPVENTVFDLRAPRLLTPDLIEKVPGEGYDHSFCLEEERKRFKAAVVKHIKNGRRLTIETTQPGIQLYTGNFLNGMEGKRGIAYNKHSAFCLEAQNWPNAINNTKFPNSVLHPSEKYEQTIWLTFDAC